MKILSLAVKYSSKLDIISLVYPYLCAMKSFACKIYIARLLVGVALSIMLWGCNGSHSMDAVLTHAEQMIEYAPDSALQILQSIEQPQRLRRKGAARYALARTMAEHRCHHVFTSDSLIQIAVDYYGIHSGLHSALTYYCLGCVYSELGNDEAAVDAYLRAKELFPDKQNRYYGLVAGNLGQLYYRKNMYEKALDEFSDSRRIFFHLGEHTYHLSLIYREGLTYLAMNNYDMAHSAFSIIDSDDSEAARPLRIQALYQLANTSCEQRKFFAAYYYINRCLRLYSPEELFADIYAVKGHVSVVREELDTALYYYRKGLECSYEPHAYAEIYDGMADVFRFQNVMDSVAHYQKLGDLLKRDINRDEENDEVYTVLSQYQVEKALADRELRQRRERYTRYRIVGIVGCVIASLLILFVWLIKRYKRSYSYTIRCLGARYPYLIVMSQSSPTQLLLESASQTSLSYSSFDDSFTDVLQTCAESFKSTALYEELFSIHIKEAEIMQLHHYTRSEELREGMFVHFEPVIRELCAHVRLSDKHIIHCLCRYLGIPTATIAYCLHTTVRSLSKDKTRLQQKLPENYAVVLLGNGCRRGRPKSL